MRLPQIEFIIEVITDHKTSFPHQEWDNNITISK